MANPSDSGSVFSDGDALLVVDVQRDFCPGGALAVPSGDRILPTLNRWLAAAERAEVPVFASRDWHPADHCSFTARGGPWPPHCVRDTEGALFHEDLGLPDSAIILDKGQARDRDAYSAFEATGIRSHLRELAVRRLFIGGLALDVCVHATVLSALDYGLDVRLLLGGTRSFDVAKALRCLEEMKRRGVVFVEGVP